MWFGMMWWWVIPLVFFLMMRGNHHRWQRRARWEGEQDQVAELRRVVDDQRGYIEELEARLARVEDGLEFAERLLAERGVASGAVGGEK
jgi:hypothetical protein